MRSPIQQCVVNCLHYHSSRMVTDLLSDETERVQRPQHQAEAFKKRLVKHYFLSVFLCEGIEDEDTDIASLQNHKLTTFIFL